jgi:hypothetical protein
VQMSLLELLFCKSNCKSKNKVVVSRFASESRWQVRQTFSRLVNNSALNCSKVTSTLTGIFAKVRK